MGQGTALPACQARHDSRSIKSTHSRHRCMGSHWHITSRLGTVRNGRGERRGVMSMVDLQAKIAPWKLVALGLGRITRHPPAHRNLLGATREDDIRVWLCPKRPASCFRRLPTCPHGVAISILPEVARATRELSKLVACVSLEVSEH